MTDTMRQLDTIIRNLDTRIRRLANRDSSNGASSASSQINSYLDSTAGIVYALQLAGIDPGKMRTALAAWTDPVPGGTAGATPYTKPHGALTTSAHYAVRVTAAGGSPVSLLVEQNIGPCDFVAFGFSGSVTVTVTALGSTSISAYSISPLSYSLVGTVSGNQISFTLTHPAKIIVHHVTGTAGVYSRQLCISAQANETNVPTIGGNVIDASTQPNVDKTGATNSQAGVQSAINNRSWGQTLYFPAGLYALGTGVTCKSGVNIYLAPGAILQLTASASQSWGPILMDGCSDVHIYGRGVIDGNDVIAAGVQNAVQAKGTLNCSVEGITLVRPGNICVNVRNSRGFVLKDCMGLTATGAGYGGVTLGSCIDCAVIDTLFFTGDDCFDTGIDTSDLDTPLFPRHGTRDCLVAGLVGWVTTSGGPIKLNASFNDTARRWDGSFHALERLLLVDCHAIYAPTCGISGYSLHGSNVRNLLFIDCTIEKADYKPFEFHVDSTHDSTPFGGVYGNIYELYFLNLYVYNSSAQYNSSFTGRRDPTTGSVGQVYQIHFNRLYMDGYPQTTQNKMDFYSGRTYEHDIFVY